MNHLVQECVTHLIMTQIHVSLCEVIHRNIAVWLLDADEVSFRNYIIIFD